MDADERTEAYRVFMSEHLRALLGSQASYYGIIHGAPQGDFNAEEVVDRTIARMGIEVM